MSEWKEVKLGEIAKVISGYAFKSVDFIKDDGVPAIKIKNIKTGEVDLTDIDFVSEIFLSLNEKYHIKYNDILISLTGSHLTQPNSVVGRVGIYKHKITSLLNQRAGKFLPNLKLVNQLYLYSFLSQDKIKETIALKARGAANQANISPSDVEDTDILLPPLPTQQRIASILSAYDDLIEKNLKRIKLLEEIAQRTYEEWFVKFRINGVQLEVGENGLPEGWEEKTIGEFIKFYKGKKADSIQPNYEIGLERLLLLDGIESGNYPYTNPDKQVIAEQNDLLMLMDGARSSKVFFAEKGVVGSTLSKIEIVEPKLSSSLLKLFFDNNFDWMQTNNTGAAIPHANKNFINSMPFNLPTDKILMDWKNKIETLYSNIRNMKNQNHLLKESRDILLPRLMSGKVGV
jgi:type I restriction enzyme S subunit